MGQFHAQMEGLNIFVAYLNVEVRLSHFGSSSVWHLWSLQNSLRFVSGLVDEFSAVLGELKPVKLSKRLGCGPKWISKFDQEKRLNIGKKGCTRTIH
jgi:hypothetical protein